MHPDIIKQIVINANKINIKTVMLVTVGIIEL